MELKDRIKQEQFGTDRDFKLRVLEFIERMEKQKVK